MAATAGQDAKIRELMEAVDRADRIGNRAEADRNLQRALELAPGHPGILNAMGMRALLSGDAKAAQPLLEQATLADPSSATLWLNLALAWRELKDEARELEAVDKALAADPRAFTALLHKARLLERQGKAKAAAFMYQAFLFCLPPGGQQPPALQAAIDHANQAVAAHMRATEAFLEARVAEARARHTGAPLGRFDACYEMLMGRRGMYTPAPTFMLFPRLPAVEFPEREGFPWLDAFEAATAEIRAEAEAVFREGADFNPYISKPTGAPLDQWRDLNDSKRWSSYFLLKNGTRIEEHLARCPKTAALLAQAPLCDVPEHAPTAFFSVLAPKTRIPPHTGVTNTRFIVHLPLVVPPGCSFRVGADRREWKAGKAWVFDDTFEHEAWNDSDEPRIILIFDVWNSFLTAAERDLVSVVTRGVHEFGEGESPFTQGGYDDELALRVAGLHDENDGGQVKSVNGGGDENTTTPSWRTSLRWAPTDTIDATLTYQWLRSNRDTLTEVEGDGAGYNGPVIGDRSGLAVQESSSGGTQHFHMTTLQASWELDDRHRLVYSGAHQDNKFNFSVDQDIYNGVSDWSAIQETASSFKVDTQELRLESTSPENFMDYLLGLWYQKDDTGTTFAQPTPQSGAFGDPMNPSPFGAPDSAYVVYADGSIPTKAENYAIYSNTVLRLRDDTSLSLGVRYLRNESDRGQTVNTSSALIDVPLSPGTAIDCSTFAAFAPFTGNQRFPGYCELALPAGSFTQSGKEDDDAWVYQGSLQHNFTDDLMTYFTYAHSWRPAGITVGITSPVSEDLIQGDPEESDSFELGLRSLWMDGRVRANVSVYHQEFQNFIGRFNDVPYLGPGPSVQAGGFTYPGDASVDGFETEIAADISEQWWVQLTTSYADSGYDDATVPCRDTNLDGNPDTGDIGNLTTADFGTNSVIYCNVNTAISDTPKWVATVQSEYSFPVFAEEGFVRLLFNYYSRQQDFGNYRADAYGLLNLFAGVRSPENQWEVTLWTKNLLDEDTRLKLGEPQTAFGAFPAGYFEVGYVPEREVGLTVSYLFDKE